MFSLAQAVHKQSAIEKDKIIYIHVDNTITNPA